jgi:hypothetical protein
MSEVSNRLDSRSELRVSEVTPADELQALERSWIEIVDFGNREDRRMR